MDTINKEATLREEIIELFESVQESTANHQKKALFLKKLLDKHDHEVTSNELKLILQQVFEQDHKAKNPYVKRTINFITTFCFSLKSSSENDEVVEHPLLARIFNYLLQCQRLKHDSYRYFSCLLLGKIFESLEEISNNLFEQVKNAMLERIRDPKAVIRLQAIKCLHRLQDPSDKEDAVIQQLLEILSNDLNPNVRRLCLEKIAIRKDVLPIILTRARDTNLPVRVMALQRLKKCMRFLTIADRRALLIGGFWDPSEQLRQLVTTDLFDAWLDSYENDCLKILESIRLDADESDVEKTSFLVDRIVDALFSKMILKDIVRVIPINNEKCLDYKDLNFESAIYWRKLVEHLRKFEEHEDVLLAVAPELVDFCQYIKGYLEYASGQTEMYNLEHQFVLQQLFLITKGYDVSDNAGRQYLNSLIDGILQETKLDPATARAILSNLENTIPNDRQRLNFLCELISGIIYFTNADDDKAERLIKISSLKTDLRALQHAQEKSIKEKNYLEASRLEKEIETMQVELQEMQANVPPPEVEKRTDVATILKYLTISQALLESPKITELTPELQELKINVIQEVIMHKNDEVKAKALSCYALCCIIDIKSAMSGIHIFSAPILGYQDGEECNIQVLVVCIKAVADLISIYGSSLVAEPTTNYNESQLEAHESIFTGGTSLTELIQGLADLMDDEQLEVQEASTRALSTLLLDNRVRSASLIARLVLKWANPISDDFSKQFIGYTLDALPSLPNYTDFLTDAICMIMSALVYAPPNSPLAEVNEEDVAKFMIALCQKSSENPQTHWNLAVKLCDHMLLKPRAKVVLVFSKILLMLQLPNDRLAINDLMVKCDELLDNVRDKAATRNITKFVALSIKDLNTPVTQE